MKMSTMQGYTKQAFGQRFQDFSTLSETATAIVGNTNENYAVYEDLADYKKLAAKKIVTKLKNFQVHRIIRTKIGSGPNAHLQEDKITITDPIIYFYRAKGAGPYPGGMAAGEFEELCQKKCIKGCNDGFWWMTKFRSKADRKLRDASVFRNVMNDTANAGTRQDVLKALGVLSKGYDSADLADVHSCKFGIGREAIYPQEWYESAGSLLGDTVRDVTDYITFDMYTYISFRCFRGVK